MQKHLPSLAVPLMADDLVRYWSVLKEQIKGSGAGLVWVCPRRYFDPQVWQVQLEYIPKALALLQGEGLEAGVWMQSFGFGTPLPACDEPHAKYQRITEIGGGICGDAFCPTDPDYTAFMAMQVRSYAKAGAKRIMLDDDLCLNIRPGLGCACPGHMAAFEKLLGRPVRREELRALLYEGESNAARKLWYRCQGDSLRDFCRAMRAAADEVDPAVQLGFCAGYTSWDLEGADALELTAILAGQTRPFLRLTGAPYWVYTRRFPGQNMAHIVEFTRMQLDWCRDSGVDVFYENDSFPRPTYKVPAALLQTFDFCLSAHGCMDQLKYLFDYEAHPQHETGYLRAHLRDRDVIAAVSDAMGAMPAAGVYVHEDMHKFADMTLPNKSNDYQIMHTAFSGAADLLSGVGIPIKYQNDGGVTAAFGHAGRTVPLGQPAYILDVVAAAEMQKRGVNVGLGGFVQAAVPEYERYVAADDHVQLLWEDVIGDVSEFYRADLVPAVAVESWFTTGNDKYPASYSYTNAQGIRFLVFLFRADTIGWGGSLARSYYRQQQLTDFLARAGRSVPAVIRSRPEHWLLCKQNADTLAVAVCNFSLDQMDDAVLQLSEKWKIAEFIGMTGVLQGDKVLLDTIPAYRFGAVVLKK